MSWNNFLPGWMFGEFHLHFEDFINNKIDLKSFVDKIENLKEVPSIVKQNWRDKLND